MEGCAQLGAARCGVGTVIPGDAHDGQRLEIATLRAENDRLTALLESHGIEWRAPQSVVVVAREPEPSRLSTADKVALFRRLFRGRTDVYPVRWEGKTSGKSGYAPACANFHEWSPHTPDHERHNRSAVAPGLRSRKPLMATDRES